MLGTEKSVTEEYNLKKKELLEVEGRLGRVRTFTKGVSTVEVKIKTRLGSTAIAATFKTFGEAADYLETCGEEYKQYEDERAKPKVKRDDEDEDDDSMDDF